jgi:hypothetical protein
VGQLVSTVTFGRSDAEVAQILTWFMLDKIGEPPEGTPAEQNQWRLEQAHREMLNYVAREARRNRLRELNDNARLEEQADDETNLATEPTP